MRSTAQVGSSSEKRGPNHAISEGEENIVLDRKRNGARGLRLSLGLVHLPVKGLENLELFRANRQEGGILGALHQSQGLGSRGSRHGGPPCQGGVLLLDNNAVAELAGGGKENVSPEQKGHRAESLVEQLSPDLQS